jgi:hypothetical protein
VADGVGGLGRQVGLGRGGDAGGAVSVGGVQGLGAQQGLDQRGRCGGVWPPLPRAPSTRHGTRSPAPGAAPGSGRSGLPAFVLASLPSLWVPAMAYLLFTRATSVAGAARPTPLRSAVPGRGHYGSLVLC